MSYKVDSLGKKNKRTLTVGASDFKPLVIETNGVFKGFEIELWEKIASMIDVEIKYEKFSFRDLLPAIYEGMVDVGIAGISRTVEREKVIDFTHLTFNSGLRILVNRKRNTNLFETFRSFFKIGLLKPLLLLIIFIISCSHLIWYLERGLGNISTQYVPGIIDAIWWCVVTISTVGYGDIVPVTVLGRFAGIFVIFIGFIIFGTFTGFISSKLTVQKIFATIKGPKDLIGRRVGTVAGSVAVEALVHLGADVVEFKNINEAYNGLRSGKLNAVVFDSPVLEYFIRNNPNEDFNFIGGIFARDTLGFAVKNNSSLREEINVALLYLRETGYYDRLYRKWFGYKI